MKDLRLGDLLRQARGLETPDCLSFNEIERAVLRPELLPDDQKSHLETCHLCKASVALFIGDCNGRIHAETD